MTLNVREVTLPIAFDHPEAHEAMRRYASVRPDAPWCPDNVEFIRRMNDLDGFVIQRATGTGAVSAAYAQVGKVTLTDQNRFRKERRLEWVDTAATPGERYFYRVIAVTLDGDRSIPAGPVSVQFGPVGGIP